MDSIQFDQLARILTLTPTRRKMALCVLSTLVGFGSVTSAEAKHPKKKACPPCKGRKHKKGKCKTLLPDGTPCDGGTCQAGVCVPNPPVVPPPPPPPPAVCEPADGIKNGTETGIDCGGLCPRCPNGQPCLTQDDCLSAFCANGVCQECGVGLCGSDANGACICQFPSGGGAKICRTAKGTPNSSCLCPPGTRCFNGMVDGCYKYCGAP